MAQIQGAGLIAIVLIIAAFYIAFFVVVGHKMIKNNRRFKRNQKRYDQASRYQPLESDIELAQRSTDHSVKVAQLPTREDGGEDLEGKPILQLEGNPVHQLAGVERPLAPYELDHPQDQSRQRDDQSQSTAPPRE